MDQAPNPSGIVFEDEQTLPAVASAASGSQIIRWVIAHSGGYVKSEKQAVSVLIGFVAVALCASVLLLISNDRSKPKPPAAILQQMPVNR